MREFFKKTYLNLPLFFKRFLLTSSESYHRKISLYKEGGVSPYVFEKNLITKKTKKRVLIYHKTGLYYGGTEKTLQTVALALTHDFNVYLLHASDETKPNRKKELQGKVHLITFSYAKNNSNYPYHIEAMSPTLNQVIKDLEIDLVFTSGAGKAEYPCNTVISIPIILINIFGAPCLQKNIVNTIFISQEILNHSEKFIGKQPNNVLLYSPASTDLLKEDLQSLRKKLAISDDSFVFGRIGRGSDDIFDPIGIRAFQELLKREPSAHYIIVSPPPLLVTIVEEEKIPNVHLLPPTSIDEEIWSFYYAIDTLAHFRFDGETQGINIGEAMFAGNPIITHRSHIWNSHTEYLDDSFARIVNKGDTSAYTKAMEEFIALKKEDPAAWLTMRLNSKKRANELFLKKTYCEKIVTLVHTVLFP